jgi:DNA-directed RNA polymerase specialized sigma24 family protein
MTTDERRALMADNDPLAKHVLRKTTGLRPDHPEFDDALQEARLGLALAAQRYDPARGVRFGTFAFRVIYNRLQDFQQTVRGGGFRCLPWHKDGRADFRPRRLPVSRTGRPIDFADHRGGGCPPSEVRDVAGLVQFLEPRLRRLLRLRLSGMKFKDIAERFGFTQTRAIQLYNKALVRLRRRVCPDLAIKPKNWRPWSKADEQKCRDLRRAGRSWSEIAAELGRTTDAIAQRLAVMRRRGRAAAA